MKTDVTVFTTVFNVAEYLPRFFDCMLGQSYPDFLLLIIDDGSTDDTLEICRKYADKDGRIKVVHTEHIGIAAARNMVLPMIETPFAASADADDVYERDYLLHLVEAQKKYDADLVISRVIYRDEAYNRRTGFVARGEQLINREDFKEQIPALLKERRLNYLYGKLYRSKLLRTCSVEPDVRMGSDTMINSQYVLKINSIALIDDEDVNYINYQTRSVTSYIGPSVFSDFIRIQSFIADTFRESELWSDEMQRICDGRMLISANHSLAKVAKMQDSLLDKYIRARDIVHSSAYQEAYERQRTLGNLEKYPFHVIEPGEEVEAMNRAAGLCLLEKRELDELKKENRWLQSEVDRFGNSNSWRIGRVITFPVRMFKLLVEKVRKRTKPDR